MPELILQYIIVVALVVGLGYLIYFLKEKGVIRDDDYFGITYTILGSLEGNEATPENVKKILKAVASAVHFVESEYKDDDNTLKEQKALELSKQAIELFNFKSDISEDSLRYIIRIAATLLPKNDNNGHELQ